MASAIYRICWALILFSILLLWQFLRDKMNKKLIPLNQEGSDEVEKISVIRAITTSLKFHHFLFPFIHPDWSIFRVLLTCAWKLGYGIHFSYLLLFLPNQGQILPSDIRFFYLFLEEIMTTSFILQLYQALKTAAISIYWKYWVNNSPEELQEK